MEFYNIMSFLHSCNNEEYPAKDEWGYKPKKKLGILFGTSITTKVWRIVDTEPSFVNWWRDYPIQGEYIIQGL